MPVLLVIVGWLESRQPRNQSLEWTEVVVGVLVFIAPFVLGFASIAAIAWSAWITGALAVLLAASVLYEERQSSALLVRTKPISL